MEVKLTQDQKLATTVLLQEIEELFSTMKWIKNYDRKNVSDGGCNSMSLGYVYRFEFGDHGKHGVFSSANNTKYPVLYEKLLRLSNCCSFPCSTFCINKLNQGESITVVR